MPSGPRCQLWLKMSRIARDDRYFRLISTGWGEALKTAFHSLPDFGF